MFEGYKGMGCVWLNSTRETKVSGMYRVEYVGWWRTYDVFQLYKLEVLEGKRGDEMFEGMNAS